MKRKGEMEIEKLGETLLYIVFALAAIAVIIYFLKGCQAKQTDLTGKKILCPLNPEACKQKEQDQADAQTGGVTPPSLKESFEKCYNEKNPVCPEALQALNKAVGEGSKIEVKNTCDETWSCSQSHSEISIGGEVFKEKFILASCVKGGSCTGDVHIQKGQKDLAELSCEGGAFTGANTSPFSIITHVGYYSGGYLCAYHD